MVYLRTQQFKDLGIFQICPFCLFNLGIGQFMKICFNMSIRQVKYLIIAGFCCFVLFCFIFRQDHITMCTSEWSWTHHIVHVVLKLKVIFCFSLLRVGITDTGHYTQKLSFFKNHYVWFTTYQNGTYW